jgi:hypothetical protein
VKSKGETSTAIPKPHAFDLNKFRSKRSAAITNVETLQTALPHHKISEAKDFVRLHQNEQEYWSPELCFVSVPIKGQKRETLHLIDEDLAMRYLPAARIQRFRLALATKPYDAFFLCQVPTRNEDNSWNASNLQACEQAKTHWVMASSGINQPASTNIRAASITHSSFRVCIGPPRQMSRALMTVLVWSC